MQETLVQFLGWEDPLEDRLPTPGFLGFPGDSDGKESACNVGDLGSTPGLGRSHGGGYGNSLQYSCPENPHEQRSLPGYTVHEVAKSWTRPSDTMSCANCQECSGTATVWCRAWLESILGMGCRSQQFKFDCTKKLTSKFHLFEETMCVYCDRLNYYPSSYCYARCPNPRAGREKASKTMQHAKKGKFIADSSQGSCRNQRSRAGSESPEPTLLSKFIGCA